MSAGENKRIKFVIDYKDQLVEIFPFIHEREMAKILKNMSVVVSSYLGKGMRGMKIFPHLYSNSAEKYTNKITISKTGSKSGETKMSFRYKRELARRLRMTREAKINKVSLDITVIKADK